MINEEDELEEISFMNMVRFHRIELNKMLNGTHAAEVFPSRCERVKLVKKGILFYREGSPGKRVTVSQKARTLLQEPI